MPIVPLHGHSALRARIADALSRGTLPQSLLLHGEAGVGKQRLALWIAQALTCDGPVPPCGECRHCQYGAELSHPDVHWVFPRPKLRDSDPSLDDIRTDLFDAIRDRVKAAGLYPPPPGGEGIYVATTRLLVQMSAVTPAMARRKVFVVGDADRMSPPQENAEAPAANAFLKLLEEPPADTYVILTSSAPGALLPTIRSRVVAVRVAPLAPEEVGRWLSEDSVRVLLEKSDLPRSAEQRIQLAAGAPGRLLAARESSAAAESAQRLLEVALSGDRAKAIRVAMTQGASGARGAFSDILDALTAALHQRARRAVENQDDRAARNAARAVTIVEDSKLLAGGNVNPQLVTAGLLSDLARVLNA